MNAPPYFVSAAMSGWEKGGRKESNEVGTALVIILDSFKDARTDP